MQFNVAQLLKETTGAIRTYTIDVTAQIAGVNQGARLVGEVQLLRTKRSIVVQGTLRTSFSGICSRCLEDLEQPLAFRVEEEFFPTVDVLTGQPLLQELDADTFTIDKQHTLDLTELVRQQAVVTTPMQPVCRPDCAGLCVRCGYNLNRGPCSCQGENADSPFAILKDLKL